MSAIRVKVSLRGELSRQTSARVREAPGEPNSQTRIELLRGGPAPWRYRLLPVTGRKHQLRVHMAALGAPILHDRMYPAPCEPGADDHARPLRLFAASLEFDDPLDGSPRRFSALPGF